MPGTSRSRTKPKRATKGGGGGGGGFFKSIVMAVIIAGVVYGFWQVPADPNANSLWEGVTSRAHQINVWVHQTTDPVNKEIQKQQDTDVPSTPVDDGR